MPGGIGRVDGATLAAGGRRRRRVAVGDGTNDIFYHLDTRHVCLDRASGQLYFVDDPQCLVATTVGDVLAGMGDVARFEQLHLDVHGLFDAARRTRLTPMQATAVLTALRLVGIHASIR